MLLDVRTEEEYDREHAAGAKNLPVDEIDEEAAKELLPDKNVPVLVYCRSGQRAVRAYLALTDLGYRVYSLGGLNGWPYGMEIG